MKKLLIIAALAMCCCKQQTAEFPYTFMGISLDVTPKEFNQKLKERGFTENEDGAFAGSFFGYPCVVDNNWPELAKMAEVYVCIDGSTESVFDDIREALMEKYSDTSKWRIEEDAVSTFLRSIRDKGISIYSTDDDSRYYIMMIYHPMAHETVIFYYNMDYYKNIDYYETRARSDRMQDL